MAVPQWIRRTFLVPALLAVGAPGLVAPPVTGAGTIVRTWVAGSAPVVRVYSNDARVRVKPWPADSIALVLKHVIKSQGWRHEEYEPRIRIESRGDTISIEALTGGGRVVVGAIADRFEIELRVPSRSTLDLATGEGDVTIGEVAGRTRVDQWSGSVRLRGTRGDVAVQTRGGNIHARRVRCALEAETLVGNVDVSGQFDRLRVRSGTGALRVSVEPGSAPTEAWSLETTTGALDLALPRDFAVALDASTESGRFECGAVLPAGAAREDRALRTAPGGGGTPLRARTGSGALRVRRER